LEGALTVIAMSASDEAIQSSQKRNPYEGGLLRFARNVALKPSCSGGMLFAVTGPYPRSLRALSPLVPAQAGTEGEHSVIMTLVPRFRGDERREIDTGETDLL
jgi:hypothetical protein